MMQRPVHEFNSPILNAVQQERKESLNQPQFDKHFSLNEILKLTDLSARLLFLCGVSVVYCPAFRGFVFLTGCYDVMRAFFNYFLRCRSSLGWFEMIEVCTIWNKATGLRCFAFLWNRVT